MAVGAYGVMMWRGSLRDNMRKGGADMDVATAVGVFGESWGCSQIQLFCSPLVATRPHELH